MMSAKKMLSLVALLVAGFAVSGMTTEAKAVPKAKRTEVGCVVDVVVETRNQSGTVVSTETYQREFTLVDGQLYSEDFSTPTRFKFFDADMSTTNGVSTINMYWFADVTVFNSVEVSTTVSLGRGRKDDTSSGTHILYTSTGSTRTSFSLSCVGL